MDAGHSHKTTDTGMKLFTTGTEDFHRSTIMTFEGDTYYAKSNGTSRARCNIEVAAADIAANGSGVGGVSSGRFGEETRPKNMNVVYIIRIM